MFVRGRVGLVAIACPGLNYTPAVAENMLVSPPSEVLRLLFDQLDGSIPDFDALARRTPAVQSADEFTRAQKIADEVSRLQGIWDSFDSETSLQFNLNVRVGEYDGTKCGFPIPLFYPGTFIQGSTPVVFRNAPDAVIFPATPADRPDILAKLGVTRSAQITVTLDNLSPSALRSNAIEGLISEVVLRNGTGTEVGRYSPEQSDNADALSVLEADEVAARIAKTLNVPMIGATWEEVTPFLEAQPFVYGTGRNFSGQLFSFVQGTFQTQRPLEGYNDLTLAFGQSENAAGIALRQSTRRSFGINGAPRPFGMLDCSTPEIFDSCGIMKFRRMEGQLVLTDIITVSEHQNENDVRPNVSEIFGSDVAASMSTSETQVAYSESELGGQGHRAVGANLYWAGEISQTPMPLFDPRHGFADSYSAPEMLWVVDAQADRTVMIFRASDQ